MLCNAMAESDASVFEGMETRSLMGKGTHEEIVLPTDTVYLGSVFHNIASRAIHEYQPCTSGITAGTGNGNLMKQSAGKSQQAEVLENTNTSARKKTPSYQ